MPWIPAKNKCQPIVLNAIKVAVPGFKHKCTCTSHKPVIVCTSRINKYCVAVNGTTTNLLPTGQYSICHQLAINVIKRKLDKNLSVRTTKINRFK